MKKTLIHLLFGKDTILGKIVKKISKIENLIAEPNLYFDCSKRIINPKVFLTDEHIKDCQVVSSREELLFRMEKGKVWAEVGVAEGYYSDKILSVCKPTKLYMIEYCEEYANNLRKHFSREIETGVVEVLVGDSVDMLNQLNDSSLDYVFLDATHDYKHPHAELVVCEKKVKKEGLILGHDYTRFSLWESEQYGVVEAVNSFCIEYGYELVFLTLDILQSNASYGLRKMESEKMERDK